MPPAATATAPEEALAPTPERVRQTLTEHFTGPRKAGILMVMLGEESSAAVLRELSEDEITRLGREIARVTSVTGEQGEAVIEELYHMSVAQDYVLRGGMEYAERLLVSAFGNERAKAIFDRLVKTIGVSSANLDALRRADPSQLAKFIHSEHPQTIALVLSHLIPAQAASLLVSLPAGLRSDVAQRMANLDQISPEIITKIADIIGEKSKALGEVSRESFGGVRAVAEMFNRMETNVSKEVLESIEESNQPLVETIRHLMFVFDDLLLVDAKSMKEFLGRTDRKLLTVALKGTSDQMKEHFTSNMSQRGAQMLQEDMEALGPIKIKDVEAAQQSLIAVVRQLEAEGIISTRGGGSDGYVS